MHMVTAMLAHRSLPSLAEHCAASARAALQPRAGEQVLEIGPGTGLPLAYYAMFKPCARTANP